MPNRDTYQNAIVVQAAEEAVGTDLVVGCSYDDDLREAAETALAAVRNVDGVHDDPAPVAAFSEFGDSGINLGLRYWSDSRQAEIGDGRHRVLMAVKAAFDDAGLEIPWPVRTLGASGSLRDALVAAASADAEPGREAATQA